MSLRGVLLKVCALRVSSARVSATGVFYGSLKMVCVNEGCAHVVCVKIQMCVLWSAHRV